MKITNKELLIKKILIIFLILQPFLDTYILFEGKIIDIFKISPSTIIRLLFVLILGILSLTIIKSKKQIKSYIIYGIVLLIYSVFHIYNAYNFNSLTPGNFNFNIITEVFYIIRMIIPIFIIILTSNIKFSKESILKILNILIILFSGTIVITNILKISIGAYITKPIEYNIFNWFINNIHETHSFYNTASRGYFSFANMISSLLFGMTAVLYYQLYKKFNYKIVILIIIQMLAMFILGTKVSTMGFLLSTITMFILYLFFCIIKKDVKFNYKIIITITLVIMSWAMIYPYSPCNNRSSIVEEETQENKEELEKPKLEIELEGLTEEEKGSIVKEFVYNNYNQYGIREQYILEYYPYEYDAYFWYKIFDEPYNVRSDNRELMIKILDRLKFLNNNEVMDNLFGITYSRMSNISYLEQDFLSQYYTLGILGSLLLTLPYILILIGSVVKVMLDKKKFDMFNISLILCCFCAIAGAFYCGNSLDNLTFTIIYGFIFGILITVIFTKKEKKLKEDEITIMALHLNYGGVEQYISSLCKMLGEKYKINIITTYKINDKPAFEFDENIKITYLIKGSPNKQEILKAIKEKKFFNIIKEGIKSIKILYLKRKRNIIAIKSIDSKYIITTRTFHNRLVGYYSDKKIIKIATEHNYHNNNKKYINKVIQSIKGFDYFILVTENLKEFYQNKVNNTKCIYIPNVIDKLPNKSTKLKNNNIINIGRLEQEKAQEELIDIVKELKKEIKDIKLFLIGDGSLRHELNKKIKENNLEDNIILTGFLSKEEMEKYFIDSKLFVMTSYTESFGLVLIEAMSYKVPCIAYDSADGAKVLLKNDVGILIENREKKQMVIKIKELLKDNKKLKEYSEKGYNSCKSYLIENVKKQWLEILNRSNDEK